MNAGLNRLSFGGIIGMRSEDVKSLCPEVLSNNEPLLTTSNRKNVLLKYGPEEKEQEIKVVAKLLKKDLPHIHIFRNNNSKKDIRSCLKYCMSLDLSA